MGRKVNRIAISALALLLAGCAIKPDDTSDLDNVYCWRPDGVEAITRKDALPPALQQQFDGYAMPGEAWNDSDVMDGRPSSGVEFIWQRGNRWVFVVGYGGIGTSYDVAAYDIGGDGKAVRAPVAIEIRSYNDMCKLVRAFFRH
jgi:hypothetical protein